jgi:hypothetical protein
MQDCFGVSEEEYWYYTFVNEAIDPTIRASYDKLELIELTFKTIENE